MAYTIDDLNALVQAASGDELPIWDVSATGNEEPTKKITLQNLASAILPANFTYQANTIAELNAVISGLSSAERTTVFLSSTVLNELIGQSAPGTALMTKMDTNTADMIIYSLGGNYVGAVRYSIATSSVSKELPVYQRYSDVQITAGDSQYQGYYYGDITLSISDDRIRSVVVYSVTSNRPAFAIRIGTSVYRVFTTVAATVITLRVFYV